MDESRIDIYNRKGALWIHNGTARQPHALLTSGKHSSGFFNSSKIIQDAVLLSDVVADIIKDNEIGELDIDRVFGSAMGATDISFEFGVQLGLDRGYTEKIPVLTAKQALLAIQADLQRDDASIVGIQALVENLLERADETEMLVKRFDVNPGDRVLLVEDVMTTGGTTLKTIAALKELGAEIVGGLCVLVNRSGMPDLEGLPVWAYIDEEMPIWTPEECPLCAEGSEAIPPKGNWEALNA